ncbi:MAG: glutamate racemase [Patescibacteria group bacterium]|nr:glutamate racemase [Patescibacteria group bacterium]
MIGIFDSGVGGLSVLQEIKKVLPKKSVYYLADQKNAPYGIKTPQKIREYTLKGLKLFESRGVELIILACNTATVSGLEYYRKLTKIPVIGLVPAIKPAALFSKSIGILATEVTKNSCLHKKYIELFAKNKKVVTLASTKLVEFVEKGDLSSDEFVKELKRYIDQFEKDKIDSLVFGCTHFVFLKPYFKRYFSYPIKYFDSGRAVALHAKRLLTHIGKVEGDDIFTTTGNPRQFSKSAYLLINIKLDARWIKL